MVWVRLRYVTSRVRVTLTMSLIHRIAPRRLAHAFTSEGSLATPAASYRVFDRIAKRRQKDCAASRDGGKRSRAVDYVRDEVADRMMERLLVTCLHSLRRRRRG